MTWDWLSTHAAYVLGLVGRHLLLALLPTLAALVVSVPLGCLVARNRRLSVVVLTVLALLAAIPALVWFVAMPIVLGTQLLDPINVGVTLTIVSAAALVRSVVSGLRTVAPAVSASASAVGYGALRRLALVELPLAAPSVLAGLRVVAVANIALVCVAGMLGLGTLGELFVVGLAESRYAPVVIGLVLAVLLSLVADGLITLIRRGALPWLRAEAAR